MPFSEVRDLLQDAIALHRGGAIAEAAARCREVLGIDPNNLDAYYYLGMMACQEGRFAEGAELAGRALAIDARHAKAHILRLRQATLGSQRSRSPLSGHSVTAVRCPLSGGMCCKTRPVSGRSQKVGNSGEKRTLTNCGPSTPIYEYMPKPSNSTLERSTPSSG
jgi:tetratricopeptide (TPR) repeat protein